MYHTPDIQECGSRQNQGSWQAPEGRTNSSGLGRWYQEDSSGGMDAHTLGEGTDFQNRPEHDTQKQCRCLGNVYRLGSSLNIVHRGLLCGADPFNYSEHKIDKGG